MGLIVTFILAFFLAGTWSDRKGDLIDSSEEYGDEEDEDEEKEDEKEEEADEGRDFEGEEMKREEGRLRPTSGLRGAAEVGSGSLECWKEELPMGDSTKSMEVS